MAPSFSPPRCRPRQRRIVAFKRRGRRWRRARFPTRQWAGPRRGPRQAPRVRRRADHVAHHGDGFAAPQAVQHPLREVWPVGTVQPGRPHDEMARPGGQHRLFAPQLRPAVGVQRTGDVVFHVTAALFSVKHVVGADVHEPGPHRLGRPRQQAGRDGVDAQRRDAARFAAGVHLGKRGAVDDRVGAQGAYEGFRLAAAGHVPRVPAVGVHRPLRPVAAQPRRQFHAELPARAGDQHPHVHQSL